MVNSILGYFTSFQPGPRLIDGGDLAQLAALLFSTKTGIVAAAGGGQANATQLEAALNRVDTVATADDSVKLPVAIPGRVVFINNNTASELMVFGQSLNPLTDAGDTIAPSNSNAQAATATGVAQATTTLMVYVCMTAGQWKQGSFA